MYSIFPVFIRRNLTYITTVTKCGWSLGLLNQILKEDMGGKDENFFVSILEHCVSQLFKNNLLEKKSDSES